MTRGKTGKKNVKWKIHNIHNIQTCIESAGGEIKVQQSRLISLSASKEPIFIHSLNSYWAPLCAKHCTGCCWYGREQNIQKFLSSWSSHCFSSSWNVKVQSRLLSLILTLELKILAICWLIPLLATKMLQKLFMWGFRSLLRGHFSCL